MSNQTTQMDYKQIQDYYNLHYTQNEQHWADVKDKIREFTKTSKRVLKNIDKGIVSDYTLKQKRISICNSCNLYNSDTSTCKKCGCNMQVKANLKYAQCPINLW